MDICNEFTYSSYLLNLLDNYMGIDDINNELKVNIYITLMALSGSYYDSDNEQKKLDLIEEFARKVNNLKVKIQLRRKEVEIDKLIDEIEKIYDKNKYLIDKYNIDKLNIIAILNGKEPKEITKIIDSFTKEKIRRNDNKAMYDNLRNEIISNIFSSNYHIMDNTLYINMKNIDDIVIPLDTFYQVFEYLLDVYDYPQPFNKNNINRMHTIMISDIIKFLEVKSIDNENVLIPIILTYIVMKIDDYNNINMSKFKIDNIKITDLYKLAEENKNVDINKSAKWQKVVIPNAYIFKRIKDIITRGTYYFQDDIFIMEDLVNKVSEFKTSINKIDLLDLIKSELTIINKRATK